jgi:hypothetical protein
MTPGGQLFALIQSIQLGGEIASKVFWASNLREFEFPQDKDIPLPQRFFPRR